MCVEVAASCLEHLGQLWVVRCCVSDVPLAALIRRLVRGFNFNGAVHVCLLEGPLLWPLLQTASTHAQLLLHVALVPAHLDLLLPVRLFLGSWLDSLLLAKRVDSITPLSCNVK